MHDKPFLMNTLKPFALATLLTALACGQAPQEAGTLATSVARTVKEVTISEGTPVSIADLKIEGMTCEMMCGGAIKKALATLPGIAGTEIKFQTADGDHAIVTYDEGKVSDEQMIEAVQKANDGAYKVLAVDITKQVKEGNAGVHASRSAAEEGSKNADVSTSVRDLVVPGLLGLLSRIVRM